MENRQVEIRKDGKWIIVTHLVGRLIEYEDGTLGRVPVENIHPIFPKIEFNGKIQIVDGVQSWKRAAAILSKEEHIGFDAEWKPDFKCGDNNPISIMQFSTNDICFIVKVKKCPRPELIKFLESTVVKVGCAMNNDLKKIPHTGLSIKNFVDITKINSSDNNRGLDTLCRKYLFHKMIKDRGLSDWSRDKLTHSQLRYAANDAWVTLMVYNAIIIKK